LNDGIINSIAQLAEADDGVGTDLMHRRLHGLGSVAATVATAVSFSLRRPCRSR